MQDNDKLGAKGQIVKVAPGYMRNHLYPKKKAVYATWLNVQEHADQNIEKKETAAAVLV